MKAHDMTPEQAVEALRKMQSQVIHGSNLFGNIADIIERLQKQVHESRLSALREAAGICDKQREKCTAFGQYTMACNDCAQHIEARADALEKEGK